MSAYTDADVEAAARTWWTNSGHDWDEHIEGEDKPYLLSEFRAVLDAVAPAIAARALREAADKLAGASPSEKFAPGWMAAEMGLRARAANIERNP